MKRTRSDNQFLQRTLPLVALVAAIVFVASIVAAFLSLINPIQISLNVPSHKMSKIPQSPCLDIEYKLVPQNSDKSVARYAAYCGDSPVSIESWTNAVASDPAASQSITNAIRASPFQAVFFETKGCQASNWQAKQFEFVLVNAPQLKTFAESSPDPNAFLEHFSSCTSSASNDVCAFVNLGGDAKLIVPRPLSTGSSKRMNHVAYSHLSAFCRMAPPDQVARLWQLSALEYQRRIYNSSTTVWFSTSGTGVAWLHFRLDSRPKYYQYNPFQRET